MTTPSLPASGSTNWYTHYSWLDSQSRTLLPLVYSTFTGKSDGALSGTTDSGHTWIVTGASPPYVRSGLLTYTATTPTASVLASYAEVLLPSVVRRIGGRFVFNASNSTTGQLTLGAFTTTTIPSDSHCHLSISPAGMEMGIWSGGSFIPISPDGSTATFQEFINPLLANGTTDYTVDIEIDATNSKARVSAPDGQIFTYSHATLGTGTSAYAFWETFTQTASDVIGGFAEVWADTTTGAPRTPQASDIAVWRAAGSGRGGAGAPTLRPPARTRPGAVWFDTVGAATTLSAATIVGATSFTAPILIPAGTNVTIDVGTAVETRTTGTPTGTAAPYTIPLLGAALVTAHASGAAVSTGGRPTFSNGTSWRDTSGLIVGNLLTNNQAIVSKDVTELAGTAATLVRLRSPIPTGRSSVVQATATGAGSFNIFTNPITPAAPFLPISGVVGKVASNGANASLVAYAQVSFYDSSQAYLTGATGSGITLTTSFQAVPVVFGTTPSAARYVSCQLTMISSVIGDVVYATEFCMAYGSITGYLEP